MSKPEPFNPDDDFDAACEALRKGVVDLALAADNDPAYARLAPAEQLSALLCGMLSGVVGVALASTEVSGHDAVMRAIATYLPQARAMADAITTEGAVH